MRELSSIDRLIIDRIIQASEAHDLQVLQIARLLRNELSVFAVEWDINPFKISIYAPRKEKKPDFERIMANYFDISYFLYLVEALDKEGYIKLQSVLSANDTYPKQLYDKEKYIKEGSQYIEKIGDSILAFSEVDYSLFNLDIVELLEKYAYKVVFPLPSLKEFKARGYITEEQQFGREEIVLSRKSVDSAKWATWAAAIGVILTAISTFKSCTDTNEVDINDADINRLEEIINTPNHIIVDDMPVITADTLKVQYVGEIKPLPIKLNVNVTPNQ